MTIKAQQIGFYGHFITINHPKNPKRENNNNNNQQQVLYI